MRQSVPTNKTILATRPMAHLKTIIIVEVESERLEFRAEVEDFGHVEGRDAQEVKVQQGRPVRGEKGDGVGLVDAVIAAVER